MDSEEIKEPLGLRHPRDSLCPNILDCGSEFKRPLEPTSGDKSGHFASYTGGDE